MWQSRTASWHRHDDTLEHSARNPMGRNALLNKTDQPEPVDGNATATATIMPDDAGSCKGPRAPVERQTTGRSASQDRQRHLNRRAADLYPATCIAGTALLHFDTKSSITAVQTGRRGATRWTGSRFSQLGICRKPTGDAHAASG